jgi:hypothetical protein
MPAGLGLESELGAGKGKAPTGGTHPSPREGEGRKKAGRAGGTGLGKAGPHGGREGKEPTAAGPRGGERREGWAGPHREKRRGRKAGLGWAARGKREWEKEKERVGRAQLEKEREKELQSNIFKFKFKWKTNNKTMQWSMRCTKPIVSYISIYGLVNCY